MLKSENFSVDFCVVGGGMAGVCAALRAARSGASVVLMQERPVLGGNASSEIRMWICGANGDGNRESGILEELALRNLAENPTKNHYIFDAILLDTVKKEKNIKLLLNCTCLDAETEDGEFDYGRSIKIKSVTGYQMTTQKMIKVEAKIFADCSGDSILAPLTGAKFRMGRESADEFSEPNGRDCPDRYTMGNSCLIQCRETERNVPATNLSMAQALEDRHFEHAYRRPDLYREAENFWYLELGGDKDTISEAEEIGEELRALALGTWQHIKSEKRYGADNFALDFLGFLPGKRESRRYEGEYIIKSSDITERVRFCDTVAYGGWTIDDHFPGGFYHPGMPNINIKTASPYPIPYRALYSKNIDNLMFAGRNVSATHMAMSSLRVMGTCSLLGEAVGVAAAVATRESLSPHGVYEKKISEVQEILMQGDCFLPFFIREISPLCRELAKKENLSELANGEDRDNSAIYGETPSGKTVKNGEETAYRLPTAEFVKSVHIVFDSDLDRKTMPGGRTEQTRITRANTLLASPVMTMPKTLAENFVLKLTSADGSFKEYAVCENQKRCHHIEVNAEISEISLTVKSNYGKTAETRIISFDFI